MCVQENSLSNTHTHTHTRSPLTLLFKACALLRFGSECRGETSLLSPSSLATAAGRGFHKNHLGTCTDLDTGQHATNTPPPPNTHTHTHTHTHTNSLSTFLFKVCALLRVRSECRGDASLLSSSPVATAAGRGFHKNHLGTCTDIDKGQHATTPLPNTHTNSPLTLLFKACALLRVGSECRGDTSLLSPSPLATAVGREIKG